MNDNPKQREYAIHHGEPFIGKDWNGKTVIMCEETIFEANKGSGIDSVYINDVVIDSDPLPAEIFKYKLKGAVKKNWS